MVVKGVKRDKIVYLNTAQDSRSALLDRAMREHGSGIRQFIQARLVAQEDQEDVFQEVFLRLARSEGLEEKLSEESGCSRSFLLQIASNLIVDRFRRAKKAYEKMHFQYDEDTVYSDFPSPEMVTATGQQLQVMMQTLKKMPDKHRQALVLNRFKQMNYSQVAQHMGISEATVHRYISSALIRLRRAIEGAE